MLSSQKWTCSWSLVATIASVVGLISIVHLFLFPVVPSFDYLGARKAQYSCLPINGSTRGGTPGNLNVQPRIDLDSQFPADLHNAVVYHGAPWKAKIGRWLSGCDLITEEVNVTEVLNTVLVCFFL